MANSSARGVFRRVPLLVWLAAFVLLPAPAASQQKPKPLRGVLVFSTVEASDIEASKSTPDDVVGRHWIVRLPVVEIRVDDPEARQAIADALDRAGKEEHVWLLDAGTSWSLFEWMAGELQQFKLARAQVEFLKAPAVLAERKQVEFAFTVARTPPVVMKALSIRISTERAGSSAQETRELPLGTLAAGVSAIAVVTADQFAEPRVKSALADVAATVWSMSRAHGVVPGAAADERRRQQAEADIQLAYTLAGPRIPVPGRPEVRPRYQRHPDDTWDLLVRGVRIIEDVRIDVAMVVPDTTHGNEAEARRQRERAEQLKAATESTAHRRLLPQLESLRGSVPTNAKLREVLNAVDAEPVLRPPASVQFQGNAIVFVTRDNAARYGFDASVDAGFSFEEGLFGKGTFAGFNLLRLSNGRNRVETETISLSGLRETQKVAGTLDVVTTRPGARATSRFTVSAAGHLSHDRNQLLGNPPPIRLGFTSRRAALLFGAEFSSALRADTESRAPRFMWSATAGPAIGFGRVTSEDGLLAPLERPSGTFAGLETTQKAQLTAELRPPDRGGVGSLRFAVEARALFAPFLIGRSFRRTDVVYEMRVTVGASRSRDYLARYRGGLAWATAATPLFELPRLGGPQQVRGIEEGERVARRLGYAQLSFGPSLEHVVTWFGKPRPKDGRLGPVPMSDVYLTAFVDRGAASNGASSSRLLWPRDVAGYGAALELQNLPIGERRARLSIGYGWSGDSQHHRRGTVVTSISIDFQ